MRRRVPVVVAVVVAVLMGLSACSLGGNAVSEQKTEQVNLANQRKAAITFTDFHGGIAKIKFEEEGSYGGSGFWAASAVVTIGGKDYEAILSPDLEASSSGPGMPDIAPPATPAPVTVVYSDGSSGVIG